MRPSTSHAQGRTEHFAHSGVLLPASEPSSTGVRSDRFRHGAAADAMTAVVPGVSMLTSYQVRWLPKDVTAGLILTALLVPQGMAYAELAGLPPITGLYTSILCLVGYALFGPSKILVLGPDSSLGPMIAATVLPLVGAKGDPARAVALASMLALLVGGITVLAGIAKLGFVADLLSKPTIIGYMNGLALTILVGQLPKLFGFSVSGDSFIDELKGFIKGIVDGETVAAALVVGIMSLLVIVACQRWWPRLPGVLAAVVLAILAANVFNLSDHGVSLVGTLPRGFPPFTIPSVRLSDLGLLFAGALGIAVVSLADTISTASSFAARSGDEVDGNREMIGIGVANIGAGFFQGFPVSTSGSRTAVAEQSGAKTQVTGLVGAHHDHLDAPGRARPAAQPAQPDPRRGGYRRGSLPRGHCRHRPPAAPAQGGVRTFDHSVRRGRPTRRAPRHRGRCGAFGRQRLPAPLDAAPGGSRPKSAGSPAITTCPATPTRSCSPAAPSSASTHLSSSPTPGPSERASVVWLEQTPSRDGSSSRRSRSPMSTQQLPTCSRISTRSSTPRA